MKKIAKLVSIALALSVTGCIDRTKNDQVLQSIEKLPLMSSPDIEFRPSGTGHFIGGRAERFGSVEIMGELVSTNGSTLPQGLADQIAARIRAELVKHGCVINGGGSGGGICYTPASGIQNANIDTASVDYSLNGSDGRAEILVIDRNYPAVYPPKARVVGQLVVTVNEAR